MEFIYKGSLTDTPVVDAIALVNYHQVPGVMKVTSGEVSRKVYFSEGNIASVASNAEEDRLQDYMRRANLLSGEQYQSALDGIRQSGGKRNFAQVLLEQKILPGREILGSLKLHMEHLLSLIFQTKDGEISFSCGEVESKHLSKVPLQTKNIIYDGVKISLNIVELRERIHSTSRMLRPTPVFAKLEGEFKATPEEQEVLAGLRFEKRVAEAVRDSRMGTLETLQFLCFLLNCRAVE